MKITETTTNDKAMTEAINAEMEAANLDRFLVRAESALLEIGVLFLGSEDEGEFKFDVAPPVPNDSLSYVEDMLVRLEKRANRKVGETDHPFTFYDFKQALGIVADVKAGLHDAEELSDFMESRRTPKPKAKKKAKPKAAVRLGTKVTGKSVSLKPVPESDDTSDRINAHLDKVGAKVKAKNAKARAKADAELDAKIKANDEALAAEDALEKEKKDLQKAKKAKPKTKTKTKK